MTRLAIKGHPTRGKEVIEILEMLGGNNSFNFGGHCIFNYYYIGNNNIIYDRNPNDTDLKIYRCFTLEKFEEKFPYKIGDKVLYYECKAHITSMRWDGKEVLYTIECKKVLLEVTVFYLQPYKEETMNKTFFDGNSQCCDIMNHLIKEETMEELIPRIDFNKYCKDKYLLDLGDYEIREENEKTYAVRKQPQYPKTYEECCKALNISNNGDIVYSGNWVYDGEYIEKLLATMRSFQKLLICRDAYWKTAGEQMGLGKSWKPDWKHGKDKFYCICTTEGEIVLGEWYVDNKILAFPTKEMRDAFYKNFKDLIEECK